MVAARKAVLGLATLLTISSTQACGEGAAHGGRDDERTIVELAAALHSGKHEAGLVRVLQDTNGGRTAVPARVADELLTTDNVAGRIVATRNPAVDDACAAFERGRVVLEVGGSAAQHLLTDMWAELSTGRVESDTLSLACTIHAVLGGEHR